MDRISFTFVNTTGTSSLSKPAAKRMRAHITRTNFVKRRRRLAGATAIESENTPQAQPEWSTVSTERIECIPRRAASTPGSSRDPKALLKIKQLTLLEPNYPPASPSEAAWLDLIASEPALVEASMAVAVRLWSPESSWQLQADSHACKAVTLIKQQIMSTRSGSDGVLGAVITMALGAALEHDDLAWNIHIDGLADIIKDRQSHPPHTVPSWLIDFIVQDSINSIFNFPRIYHRSIVQALGDYHDQRIPKLAAICASVMQLRELIDSHQRHPLDAHRVAREIEEPLATLHYETRALRTRENSPIDAAARAIELVLHLVWPSSSGAHLTLLAAELKDAIRRFPIRGCYYMNLTSLQLVIGGIAADEGSLTRAWFVDRLSGAVRAMKAQGWNEPLGLIQARLASDCGLSARFQALFEEVLHASGSLDAHRSAGNSEDEATDRLPMQISNLE